MQFSTHETFDREFPPTGASDRSFGLVFTAFFALVAMWPLLHKKPMRMWAFGVGAAFLILSLAAPAVLKPLNAAWTRFGRLLAKITNPILTALLFYLILTPAAVLLRLLGKDALRLKLDRDAPTYWIERDPAGLTPESMRNQF